MYVEEQRPDRLDFLVKRKSPRYGFQFIFSFLDLNIAPNYTPKRGHVF